MKKIYRFIIVALAATTALASCSKEAIRSAESGESTDNLRVIAVSYETTKAWLDPDTHTQKFSGGETIKISNGSKIEDCTVTYVSGTYLITTKLAGTLKAVFPASAAVVSGQNITGVKSVSNSQGSGHFINDIGQKLPAIATVSPGATNAVFKIQKAIFEIQLPKESAEHFYVSSLKAIVNGARTGAQKQIAQTEAGEPAYVIELQPRAQNFFVMMDPGVNLSDLSFDVQYSDGSYLKGIPLSKIATGTDQTVANGLYVIDGQNWHEYVTIGGLKWATMNIGATNATGDYNYSYGHLYQWGSLETLYTGLPWSGRETVSVTWKAGKSSGFVDTNLEYTGNDSNLPLERDLAYVDWGGPWRMPTGGASGEFQALVNASNLSDETINSVKFKLFTSKSDSSKKLYFPSAGYGGESNKNPQEPNHTGHCWSSTISSTSGEAYGMGFCHTSIISGGIWPQDSKKREMGFNIRPVADLPNVSAPSAFVNMHIEPTY